MTYKFKTLIEQYRTNSTLINGQWVTARPINYKYQSWLERVKEAWAVLKGRLDTVKWPEDQ